MSHIEIITEKVLRTNRFKTAHASYLKKRWGPAKGKKGTKKQKHLGKGRVTEELMEGLARRVSRALGDTRRKVTVKAYQHAGSMMTKMGKTNAMASAMHKHLDNPKYSPADRIAASQEVASQRRKKSDEFYRASWKAWDWASGDKDLPQFGRKPKGRLVK